MRAVLPILVGIVLTCRGNCAADEPPTSQSSALAAVHAEQSARAATLAQASRAVVCIFADPSLSGGGSGVLISPLGYGLTNFHVVQEILETRRGFGGLNDGRLYPLKVLGVDPGGDIAMFRLEGRDEFPFAPLGNSDDLQIGERVAAIGNPFLVAEDFTPTITFGVISGLRRYQPGQEGMLEYADCIQVSSSINPGNSGGPLFDRFGRVVGINGRGSFEERGRVNVGLGYAVSINQIKRFLPTLLAGRLCEHGTLGVTVRELDDKLIIDAMQDLSPAQSAGLELGDEPLSIAGRTLRTANDFTNILTTLPANWPTPIRFRHGGEERTAIARLERVSLRLPVVYLPEIEENAALVSRLVGAFRRSLGLSDESAAGAFEITASLNGPIETAAGPRTGRIRITADRGAEWLSDDSKATDTAPAADRLPAEPWLRDATMMLRLLDPKHLPDLIVIGGDEIEGRVVLVMELRAKDGAWARWSFDLFTLALRGCALGNGGPEPSSEWLYEAPPAGAGAALTFRRTRGPKLDEPQITTLRATGPALPLSSRLIEEPVSRVAESRGDLTTGGPLAKAIELAQARVVKISGRGIGRAGAYSSGIVVSADGRIVTGLSSMLESPALRIVLPDGRRMAGKVIARDEHRQLALLRCEATGLPFFELTSSASLQPGDWVVAASNAFKVAEGPELVSISAGMFSGRTTLAARRRAQEFSYEGLVLLTDVVVSTPGSEGGALVDADGRLVGMLGKALMSKRTNTWVSYALPVEQIAAFLSESTNPGKSSGLPATQAANALLNARRPAPETGIRLFDIGANSRPPYVERVRAGSPAAAAGLLANDLLLSLGGEHVANCNEVRALLAKLQPGQHVELTVKRGNEVKTLQMTLGGVEP